MRANTCRPAKMKRALPKSKRRFTPRRRERGPGRAIFRGLFHAGMRSPGTQDTDHAHHIRPPCRFVRPSCRDAGGEWLRRPLRAGRRGWGPRCGGGEQRAGRGTHARPFRQVGDCKDRWQGLAPSDRPDRPRRFAGVGTGLRGPVDLIPRSGQRDRIRPARARWRAGRLRDRLPAGSAARARCAPRPVERGTSCRRFGYAVTGGGEHRAPPRNPCRANDARRGVAGGRDRWRGL